LSLATVSCSASAAAAAEPRIDVPAGSLSDSIRSLSAQTGVSIGYVGQLPAVRTRPVRGARSAAAALRQMLAGSGFEAVATGETTFRLQAAPKQVPSPRSLRPAPQAADEREIVVTALKRPVSLSKFPGTLNIVEATDLTSASSIHGSEDLDRETPALSSTDVGAGRNRLFLRGIGDAPLGGYGQGSVAVLMDDARLTYDGPDPDWALVDIDRIEILEGPQGPLYGTGAIGGIVKIVTRRPDFKSVTGVLSDGVSFTQDGDISHDQSVVLNLPVTANAALRGIAYRSDQAGWIDDSRGQSDANRERLAGGRLALKLAPGLWTADVNLAYQSRHGADSQYVDGRFGPLRRTNRIAEKRDLDASVAMLTLVGPIGTLELTSITSLTHQETVADYDATPLAPVLGTVGPTRIRDDRKYGLFDQELRLHDPRSGHFDWVAGASVIKSSTDSNTQAVDATARSELLSFRRSVSEAAIFGEGSLSIGRRWSVGGGARIFTNSIEDEGRSGTIDRVENRTRLRAAGSASATWRPGVRTTVFGRVATAYRPGGVNAEPDAQQDVYRADRLASAEVGIRTERGPLSLQTTMFGARWVGVQAEELLTNGLIATINAGDALNFGIEGQLRLRVTRSTSLHLGFLAQSSKLESHGPGLSIDDQRLPAVPEAAVRVKVLHGFTLGKRWDGLARVGIDYVGATHLSFDPALDRRTRGRAIVDAGVTLTKAPWTVELAAENLGNSTADTFAFGNPFRIMAEQERTPVRPRTIGLVVRRAF